MKHNICKKLNPMNNVVLVPSTHQTIIQIGKQPTVSYIKMIWLGRLQNIYHMLQQRRHN